MKTFFSGLSLLFLVLVQNSFAGTDIWSEAGVEKLSPQKAFDFTIKDTDGNRITLDALKGKVVFLNFWATWCTPCRDEMPAMDELHKRFADKGLVIIAVNFLESGDKAAAFADKNGFKFKIASDDGSEIGALYNARLLPTSYIIDRQGQAVGKAIGAREWGGAAQIKFFEELLKK